MATAGKRYATKEQVKARYSPRSSKPKKPKRKTNKVLVSRMKVIGLAIALIVVIAGAVVGIRSAIPTVEEKAQRAAYPLKYERIINKYSKKYDLDKSLVCAVIYAESFYKADAASSAGAYGLMQLTEETFNWMQEKDDGKITYSADELTDPEINVHYGCALLKLLKDYYNGNVELMLCGYNAGIGSTDTWLQEYSDGNGGISYIPYSETESYVVIVTEAMEKYEEIYGL